MNLGGGLMGSMSVTSSNMTRKPVEVVPDQFPAGLRVLVVDDDPTCLIILEKMLRTCRYHVTKTNRAEVALTWLRENKNGFDIVISDVHMPDMDGFKLLEHVGLEMDLPVIMMSADDSNTVVMKGVTHGACDYLIKPVRIEALKNIWQHVIRKKKSEWNQVEQSSSWDDGDRQQKQDDADSSPVNEGSWKTSKRKGDDSDSDEKDDTTTLKKARVVWSVELHQQFVAAVNQLGIDKAVPKKILELMNVPGLTRENVASHLQKYRLYLRRLSGVSQQQGGSTSSFMSHDSGFGPMSSIGGIDFQALHAAGQLSTPNFAAPYARLPPSVQPSMSMPFVDQRSLFSFDNAKLRYGDVQQQPQQISNGNKQMSLLHGIPTTMVPKQLGALNQSSQNLGSVNIHVNASGARQSNSLVMHMPPQQSRGQLLHENVGVNVSRVQNSVTQMGPVVDYSSINQIHELPGSSFPIGSTPGLTSLTSKGYNSQTENNLDTRRMTAYVGSYDTFPTIQTQTSRDWQQLPNQSMSYGNSSKNTSVQNSVNVAPSVLVHQSYGTSQKHDSVGKATFATGGLDNQHLGMQNVNYSYNVNGVVDNVPKVKSETLSDIVSPDSNLFSEHYGQDDLMAALLKQQEGIGIGDYDFDGGYILDNIPVHE